jgi:hypothetical protein
MGAVLGTLSATDVETPAANLTYSFATGGNPAIGSSSTCHEAAEACAGRGARLREPSVGQKFYTVTIMVADAMAAQQPRTSPSMSGIKTIRTALQTPFD